MLNNVPFKLFEFNNFRIDCDVLESHEVQGSEWHFKAQALSAKGLQISSVEPWNGLIVKETSPCNIMYDILDQLINIPPLLPVVVSTQF